MATEMDQGNSDMEYGNSNREHIRNIVTATWNIHSKKETDNVMKHRNMYTATLTCNTSTVHTGNTEKITWNTATVQGTWLGTHKKATVTMNTATTRNRGSGLPITRHIVTVIWNVAHETLQQYCGTC